MLTSLKRPYSIKYMVTKHPINGVENIDIYIYIYIYIYILNKIEKKKRRIIDNIHTMYWGWG